MKSGKEQGPAAVKFPVIFFFFPAAFISFFVCFVFIYFFYCSGFCHTLK